MPSLYVSAIAIIDTKLFSLYIKDYKYFTLEPYLSALVVTIVIGYKEFINSNKQIFENIYLEHVLCYSI